MRDVVGCMMLVSVVGCFGDAPPVESEAEGTSADGSGTETAGSGEEASDTGPTSTTDPADGCGLVTECVPAAPPDWSGPVIAVTAVGDDALPDCPPLLEPIDLLRAQSPGPAMCECACGEPLDVACEGIVQIATAQAVSEDCPAVYDSHPISTACEPAVVGGWAAVAYGGIETGPMVEGGTCEANASASIPPVVVQETLRVCREGVVGLACDGGVCAPVLPDVGEARRCVLRDGVHGCPAEYPQPLPTFFEAFTDDRACSPCTCGPFAGLCSPPVLEVHETDDCSGMPAVLEKGECDMGGAPALALRLAFSVDGACVPTMDGPVGDFTPQNPKTICCLP